MDEIIAICTAISAIAAAISAGIAAVAVRHSSKQVEATRKQFENAQKEIQLIKAQTEHFSDFNAIQISNQQNWELFERRKKLPPALPAWSKLTDSGWAWRVLHFNHLNLLKLTYNDNNRGIITQDDLEWWILKGRYWFRQLWGESADAEIQEGREMLRQVLRPEEGYSKSYRQWLVENKIVPPELISD